ncbi:MAG: hypothetical protein M1832_002392 [Thelocarpon impressellum]|nr:MAG: hypothetical protein M1832_002392 [Thelocarpon impressellum]
MPPRSSLTSSFSVSDANNEVVCPLKNQDGSSCRKRCLGEKRYRSMQEHIRRAHPEHYISKLPATEESFALMINTPPSARPKEAPKSQVVGNTVYGHERNSFYGEGSSSPATPRNTDEYIPTSMLPAASAAAALAQLHNHRPESDWESEPEVASENEAHGHHISSSIELPGIAQMKQAAGVPFPAYDPTRQRTLLPSILSKSPPGRSSTLPPIQRRDKPNRPRKSSVTQNARRAQHERKRSRGEHVKNLSYDGRKAFSAEPTSAASAMGKRWEDLIDAATTATEEVDDDRTPIPQSPPSHRASLPPFPTAHFQSYQASPLQHALTPPSYAPEPFPSVESGENFHIESRGLEDSSPSAGSQNVQIYCAACQGIAALRAAYACTDCICGLCRDCADLLAGERRAAPGGRPRRKGCPRCGSLASRFRPFQLDIR